MKTVVVLRVFHNRIFVVERQQEENTYKGRSVTVLDTSTSISEMISAGSLGLR